MSILEHSELEISFNETFWGLFGDMCKPSSSFNCGFSSPDQKVTLSVGIFWNALGSSKYASSQLASQGFIEYRKVASSRPVYYSIFDHFWGATNQDVLLLPCPVINQLMSALFLKTNGVKSFFFHANVFS